MVNETAHVNVHKHADTEHSVYSVFTELTHGACALQPVHLLHKVFKYAYKDIISDKQGG